MNHAVRVAAVRFFDEFAEAFRAFDGNVIAQRYLSPYMAAHVDKKPDCFTDHSDLVRHFRRS